MAKRKEEQQHIVPKDEQIATQAEERSVANLRVDATTIKIVKHTYTDEELNQLQKALARMIQDLRHKEEEKKAIMSELASDINKMHAESGTLSDRINSGYEFRSMPCPVRFDFPHGLKYIIHAETGEIISEEKITDEDRQTYFI